MIDLDLYYPNKTVEEFIESLKAKFKKNQTPIKIYISTANYDDCWLKKLYRIYNNTELMEKQYE